jgi:hypothetical protein
MGDFVLLKPVLAAVVVGSLLSSPALLAQTSNACDLNKDGVVNLLDLLLASKMASGLAPCTAAIAGAGVCNEVVVMRVTAAATGGKCVVGDAHSVSLSWTASTSPNVVGYNTYRSPSFAGPFTRLNAAPVAATGFTDDGVPSGQILYYAATAVDSYSNESAYSVIASATIPHSVVLNWTASASANVLGYNVYRSAVLTGPFTKLTPSPVVATAFTDYNAPAGLFYYAATAVDISGNESAYSLLAQAVIPLQ